MFAGISNALFGVDLRHLALTYAKGDSSSAKAADDSRGRWGRRVDEIDEFVSHIFLFVTNFDVF